MIKVKVKLLIKKEKSKDEKIYPLNIWFVIALDIQSISISPMIEYLFHCCSSKKCEYFLIQSRQVGYLLISDFLAIAFLQRAISSCSRYRYIIRFVKLFWTIS